MTPEVEAYAKLAAKSRAAMDKVQEIVDRYVDAESGGKEEVLKEYDQAFMEWVELNDTFTKAFTDCVPPIIRASLFEGSKRPIHGAVIDHFIRFPLLVMEFDGDEEAASTAWALGQRPTQWAYGGDHDNP